MQFLLTNAVTRNDLMVAIKNFLSAHGWTVLVDGTGAGGVTLEITNGNSHDFKITLSDFYAATEYGVGAFSDYVLRGYFQKSDIGMAAGYTAKQAESNDCKGPFPNVWLFTDDDATYCHIVMQTANSRYNHFSFGDLNNRDLHAANLPYVMGLYHVFYRINLVYAGSYDGNPFNWHASSSHNVGMYSEDAFSETVGGTGAAIRVGLPDGIIDPTLGFLDGAVESPLLRQTSSRYYFKDAIGDSVGRFLDMLTMYDNQGYTGGVPIFPCPIIVRNAANNAQAYVGEIPFFGQVNMDGLSPGQVLDFAGEEWIVFPLKQHGTYEAATNGISPQPVCNTLNYGIAIKKADA